MASSEPPGLQEENLQGSWVELHFSSNGNGNSGQPASQEQVPASVSIYNGDMEKILLDAQHESGRSSSRESSHCDSPPRSQTPQDVHRTSEVESRASGEKNSSQSEEDFLERRKEVEQLLKKNSDWMWDWSSRPENIPPNYPQYEKHKCDEEGRHIFCRILEDFLTISPAFPSACHWIRSTPKEKNQDWVICGSPDAVEVQLQASIGSRVNDEGCWKLYSTSGMASGAYLGEHKDLYWKTADNHSFQQLIVRGNEFVSFANHDNTHPGIYKGGQKGLPNV